MIDARKALAAIVGKTKTYVEVQRKLHPLGKLRSDTPMRSSAAVKEAELLKSLEGIPAFLKSEPAKPHEVKLLFVSESALSDESSAGKLLGKIIQAMGLARVDVGVCTLASLDAKLPDMKPRALVALGEGAARAMLKSELELGKLRGRFSERAGLPVMPTHHPSEVVANETLKRHVWEDMKLVAAKLKA